MMTWSMLLLLEAAVRSFLMGCVIFAMLWVLGIRQFRAQRTAWILALAGSLTMPVLVGWPSLVSEVPGFTYHLAPAPEAFAAAPRADAGPVFQPARVRAALMPASSRETWQTPAVGGAAAENTVGGVSYIRSLQRSSALHVVKRMIAATYIAVAALLLIRLCVGLSLAFCLRNRARTLDRDAEPRVDTRISAEIAAPVTIGVSIILPESCVHWSEATWRVVLAHEGAHVSQLDFYLKAVSGLHCALFWFSPFSWWLDRRLSALGESLSDHAALCIAESHASYAEVLMEFAHSLRAPLAGVAMARPSNLKPRIELLLNEQRFRQAFAGSRRIGWLAAGLVPLAWIGSVSLVRVQAAGTATVPQKTLAKQSLISAAVRPEPGVAPAPVLPAVQAPSAPQVQPQPAPLPAESETAGESSYIYSTSDDADSFALVTAQGTVNFSGTSTGEIEKARRAVHGDFLYYRHAGSAYVIEDPILIAQAKALYAPIEELGRRQIVLSLQQEALGKEQEALGKQQETLRVPVPDLSKELAGMDAAMAELKQLQAGNELDQTSLAKIEGQVAGIEGRLGALQGLAGAQQGALGAQQGQLGAQQGKLGAQQGRLGAEQGRLAEEMRKKLLPLIEQTIRDGRAKPLD